MNIADIRSLFHQEFGALADKFKFFEIASIEAREFKDPGVALPGVYVWWHADKGVIKVGRHFKNARKRALEHLRDNTGDVMANLESDPNATLLLFNIDSPTDLHWVAALEVFFESRLAPAVKSRRLG